MYAVIETGGKQLKVEAGQEIYVEKLDAEAGDEVVFDKVCLISNEGTKIGTPYVDGAKVTAKVEKQGKEKKVRIFMLASAGYDAIINAIETGDVSGLKKMPGIGAKSASQIVLDLKGKLVPVDVKQKNQAANQYPPEINDAIEGLKGLGYKPSELGGAAGEMMDAPGLTTKEYLQMGLRIMPALQRRQRWMPV